jgi:hypothetical protein
MKHLLSTTALLSVLAVSPAFAGVGFMAGIQYDFGKGDGGFGITAKALTSDRQNQIVGAAGVGFFPFADQKFGLDADVGYTFDNGVVLGGYDFLNHSMDLAGGWADTTSHHHHHIAVGSDRRLKRDITLLATLGNGMKIYSFRYKWSDDVHVGVMAQDLLTNRAWRKAAVLQPNGFYAVDYSALGLKMCSLADWNARGLSAIEDVSYPFAIAA